MSITDPGILVAGVSPTKATWFNTTRLNVIDLDSRLALVESGTAPTTVSATDAQIKAMPTTPITLVAAQGAGTLIVPKRIRLFFHGISAYTNINADGFVAGVLNGNTVTGYQGNDSSDPDVNQLSAMFGATGQLMYTIPGAYYDTRAAVLAGWGLIGDVFDYSAQINQPLTLTWNNLGSGNLTGGNASNALLVLTDYSVVTVP